MGEAAPRPYSEPPQPDVRRFGRYTLRYRVASGGMASVYLAQLSGAGAVRKWVAVKLIHPRMEHDERFVKMFLHEAQILARLGHPNVCTLLDYGEQAGSPFIAMEYLHGESLASVIRRARVREQPVPFGIAARIVADAARGLHAAHELRGPSGEPAGVVHRDVSPQNVFVLYSGVTKVVDFGIARSEDREDTTRTGELKGKFQYMAPEQINQEPLDRRADVFALGITLWELCGDGRKLFRRDRDLDTMLAVLNEPIPSIRDVRPECPEGLAEIARRALSRDRDERYPTTDEMARALGAFCSQVGGADPESVGDWMQGLFDDRIAARNALLTAAAADTANIPIIEVESGSQTDGPGANDGARSRDAPTLRPKPRVVGSERAPLSAPAPPSTARGRRAAIAVVVGVAILAALFIAARLATGPEVAPVRPAVAAVAPSEPPPVRAGIVAVAPATSVPAEPPVDPPEPSAVPSPTPSTTPAAAVHGHARARAPVPPTTTATTGPSPTAPTPAGLGPHIMTDFESIE